MCSPVQAGKSRDAQSPVAADWRSGPRLANFRIHPLLGQRAGVKTKLLGSKGLLLRLDYFAQVNPEPPALRAGIKKEILSRLIILGAELAVVQFV